MPRSARPLLRPLRWVCGAAIGGALATASPAAATVIAVGAPTAAVPADASVPGAATAPAGTPTGSGAPGSAEVEDPYGAGLGPMDVAVGSGLVLAVAVTVRVAGRKPVPDGGPPPSVLAPRAVDEPAADRVLGDDTIPGPVAAMAPRGRQR